MRRTYVMTIEVEDVGLVLPSGFGLIERAATVGLLVAGGLTWRLREDHFEVKAIEEKPE